MHLTQYTQLQSKRKNPYHHHWNLHLASSLFRPLFASYLLNLSPLLYLYFSPLFYIFFFCLNVKKKFFKNYPEEILWIKEWNITTNEHFFLMFDLTLFPLLFIILSDSQQSTILTCLCVFVCVCPTPSQDQKATHEVNFKRDLIRLNLGFSFSLISCHTKVKEPCPTQTVCLLTEGEVLVFIPFLEIFTICYMLTVSSSIWSSLSLSLSIYIYIYIYMYIYIYTQSTGSVESQRGVKSPTTMSVLDMILNYLIVRLHTWSFEEYRVLLHWHYSLVHSDLECLYLLRSHLWVK